MKHKTGDLIQRCTSDLETLKNFISEQMTGILRILILLGFSIGFMFSMNTRLALIALAPVPVIIVYSFYFHRRIGEAFLNCDENEGNLSTRAQEHRGHSLRYTDPSDSVFRSGFLHPRRDDCRGVYRLSVLLRPDDLASPHAGAHDFGDEQGGCLH